MTTAKSVTLSKVLAELQKDKLISPNSVSILRDQDRQVSVPIVPPPGTEDPIYAAIVVDNSLSMEPYQDVVIQSQRKLLDDLRGSSLCRKKALLIAQYLFAEHLRQLKEFTLLDAGGNDEVPKLDKQNYTFDSYTALYQSVYQVLQDMATYLHFCRKEFVAAQFDLAVITDGEDNKSAISAAEVKSVVQEFKRNGILRRSVVIGLTGTDLSENAVESIREQMGFDVAIPIGKSSSEIREAFDIVSKSIAGGQQ
jgi:hypothetical protein